MATKRLEYIDAMRGFTMLLVVFSHIIVFGYQGLNSTFNSVFIQFRMPLFFFISGFVLFKADRVWDFSTCSSFLKKKFMVQIIPTVFFLVIYDSLFGFPIIDSFFYVCRNGYWFTITLFEYFIVYAVLAFCSKKAHAIWMTLLVAILLFTTLSNTTVVSAPLYKIVHKKMIEFVGVTQLMYFPFFYAGTLVKKHFDRFCAFIDNGCYMSIMLLVFFFCAIYGTDITSSLKGLMHPVFTELVSKVFFLISGSLGIVIIFTFFRKKEALFTKETVLGRSLQYVGRRTLDVYLIHYFFLPRNLTAIGAFFRENVNPSIEFFVTLIFAILVVCLSLMMSSILRLSPLLEHYLFGVKRKE